MANSIFKEAKRRAKQGKAKYSYEDLMRIREEGAVEASEAITKQREEAALKSILGRSGILPLHQSCTIENFEVKDHLQAFARDFAKNYIERFNNNFGTCFVFSGGTGTGKNHLSAAICNSLMAQGKTCLVVTVTELMIRMRKCYGDNAEYSEDEFIRQLVNFDLLILDEIGLQKGSDHEKIILNQIIDHRIGNLKPVGVLTNLDQNNVKNVLGERIFDRLKSNNSQWIPFNWVSYR
tara:strand:+ start:6540 stop:7247 length:708 start_codon:yes stop_codon:yes gene_type:complete